MNDEIEKHTPSFLWYRVVDDPFAPKIHFRFGDYALAVALTDNPNILAEISHRLFVGLPPGHQRIWDFLATGETESKVMMLSNNMTGITFAPQDGDETYHDLTNFRLRNKFIRASYVEEYDMIVISERWFTTKELSDGEMVAL